MVQNHKEKFLNIIDKTIVRVNQHVVFNTQATHETSNN